MLQTIIGSGGGIGTPLAKELAKYTKRVRLVSRNPKKVNETDELWPMDLNDFSQIDQAVEGSDVVYITVGFPYSFKVWQRTWPPFTQAVIDACIRHKAKLVFFDNVYLYAVSEIPHMTEESAIGPVSGKGKVRKELHDMIFREVKGGRLEALTVRAADFYGPDNNNSAMKMMVIDRFSQGKGAQVFGNKECIHTFTFTPDAAKATALLGNTPDAYNQVWHAPTTSEKLTTKQWIELIAKQMGVEAKMQAVPTLMVRMLGLFVPIMKEFPEMMYQFDRDYVLDSSKFEKRFGFGATPPAEGIRITLESLKK
jgi:nucleoside-diphosphate-sugar epimerase